MILETLRALRSGGQTWEDVASRLNIGRGEMRQRLELLERSGFIAKLEEASCAGTCPGCRSASSGGCSSGKGATAYALTEKGTRALDRDDRTCRVTEASC